MPKTHAENATGTLPGETVDAVVIGGGAAGLNGALMLARSRRSVLVIDSGTPRNAPAEGVHGLLGLDGLQLPMEDLPGGMGRRFASGMAGTTAVPGVWVAGNATDLTAQVGASAAAGALAGAHMNADLVTADTAAALAAAERGSTHA
jgi:thioredoxin reductase